MVVSPFWFRHLEDCAMRALISSLVRCKSLI